jgi:hypothetical protein
MKNLHRWVVLAVAAVAFVLVACSSEDDGDDSLKATFYTDALAHLETHYPQVKLANVWSERWQNGDESWSDLRVNSSPKALTAYREGVSRGYYKGEEAIVQPAPGQPIAPSANGCYIGCYPGWGVYEDAVTTQGLEDFEELVGKSVAYSPFSAYWGRNVASRVPLDTIDAYGAIAELRLMPWGDPYEPGPQPAYALERILAGDFDEYLSRWADAVRAFGKPMFATFGVEMNGDWFPWSGVYNGAETTTGYSDPNKPDGPERYVDTFHHIVDLFRERGVTNVTWVWQVNNESFPDEEWNRAFAYYPGDDYVDWVGVSAYGALTNDDEWRAFDDVFGSVYDDLTVSYPGKPLMLAEWGCMER